MKSTVEFSKVLVMSLSRCVRPKAFPHFSFQAVLGFRKHDAGAAGNGLLVPVVQGGATELTNTAVQALSKQRKHRVLRKSASLRF